MNRFYQLNLALLIACGICSADTVYTVSVNTIALVGNASTPFAIDLQLTSGNTTSGVVNTAILSNFAFGTGGSAETGGPFPNTGKASGNLGSTVVLNTSGGSFFNEFSQFFTPGNSLTFLLDLTNNAEVGGTPDEFTFQLIDKSGGEISTTDPSGSNSAIVIDLIGAPLAPQIFAFNGDGLTASPVLTSAVPEPSSVAYVIAGALLIVLNQSRPKKHGRIA